MAERTEAEQRQILIERMRRLQGAADSARGMLDAPIKDYAGLMRRLRLRASIDQTEAHIARLKARL